MFEALKIRREKKLFEIQKWKRARQLLETIDDPTRDYDEDEWTVLCQKDEKEYTEMDLDTLRKNARALCRTNAIAKGLIIIFINYVVGKRCKITPDDRNEKVVAYWDLFCRQNKFDMKLKEAVKRLLRDGELFCRFFDPPKIELPQLARYIDPEEIKSTEVSYGIETNPQDVEDVRLYHRAYSDTNGLLSNDKIPAEEIIHIKYGVDSNQKRGITFFSAIISDIKDYKNWLDDRKRLNRMRTIFSLIGKPQQTAAQSTKDIFEDSEKKSDYSSNYKKKLPQSGSMLITKGVEWDYKSLNINATDTKEDGRAILLMIAAGTGGLPEYMVTADASNANYSSTLVSEAPGVKVFEEFQDFLSYFIEDVFERVIKRGIKTGVLPQNTVHEIEKEDGTIVEEKLPTQTTCSIDFPIPIHRDRLENVKSLALEREIGTASLATISSELGRDYSKEKIKISREREVEYATPEIPV